MDWRHEYRPYHIFPDSSVQKNETHPTLNVKIGDLIVSEQYQEKRVSYNHPVARSLLSARATPS